MVFKPMKRYDVVTALGSHGADLFVTQEDTRCTGALAVSTERQSRIIA